MEILQVLSEKSADVYTHSLLLLLLLLLLLILCKELIMMLHDKMNIILLTPTFYILLMKPGRNTDTFYLINKAYRRK
jgi:hypothetical protein